METENEVKTEKLSSPKSSETAESELPLAKCPACYRTCYQSWKITDWKQQVAHWYLCACGSVFQLNPLSPESYDQEYVEKFKEQKRLDERMELLERIYLPLIEELTYGRRFLDVGFTVPLFIERLRKRGWVSSGIDLISNNGYLTGDFEKYDFKINRFNLIRLNDVLHCFDDPVGAVRKAYNLLFPEGLLLLNLPDAETIYLLEHPMVFGHWNKEKHRVYISRRQMIKVLQESGFNIICQWVNMQSRLFSSHEMHILAQRPPVGLRREKFEGDDLYE